MLETLKDWRKWQAAGRLQQIVVVRLAVGTVGWLVHRKGRKPKERMMHLFVAWTGIPGLCCMKSLTSQNVAGGFEVELQTSIIRVVAARSRGSGGRQDLEWRTP